jgi:hypothetical protein
MDCLTTCQTNEMDDVKSLFNMKNQYIELAKKCDRELMSISCKRYTKLIKDNMLKFITDNNLDLSCFQLLENMELDNSDGECTHYKINYETNEISIRIKFGDIFTLDFSFTNDRSTHDNTPYYHIRILYVSEPDHIIIFHAIEKYCSYSIYDGSYERCLGSMLSTQYSIVPNANIGKLHELIIKHFDIKLDEFKMFLSMLLCNATSLDLHHNIKIDEEEPYNYEDNKYKYDTSEENSHILKNTIRFI